MLRKELAALTPEELKFLVTRQLRWGEQPLGERRLAAWGARAMMLLLLLA